MGLSTGWWEAPFFGASHELSASWGRRGPRKEALRCSRRGWVLCTVNPSAPHPKPSVLGGQAEFRRQISHLGRLLVADLQIGTCFVTGNRSPDTDLLTAWGTPGGQGQGDFGVQRAESTPSSFR